MQVIADGGDVQPPMPVLRVPGERVRGARTADPKPWYAVPAPRLVSLGGDVVYHVELANWSKYTHPLPAGAAHALIAERFSPIRSALTVELMPDLATRSRAKTAAKSWLKEHAAFAEPTLKRFVAENHPLAPAARAALG